MVFSSNPPKTCNFEDCPKFKKLNFQAWQFSIFDLNLIFSKLKDTAWSLLQYLNQNFKIQNNPWLRDVNQSMVAKIDYTLESICILLMFNKAFIEHLIVGIKCMWYWFLSCMGDLVVVLPNFLSSFLLTWYMCFSRIYSPRCNVYVPNYQTCIICATKCWTTLFFKLLILLLLNHPIAYPLVCYGPYKFAFLFCLGATLGIECFFGEVGLLINELCFCSFWP
jgi:hypothetical protein